MNGSVEPLEHVFAFSGHRTAGLLPPSESVDEEARAALRQFSLERLMGYGVDHADAMELRGRVASGEEWRLTAAALASRLLDDPGGGIAPEGRVSRIGRLLRASALLRMSQVMMTEDDDERRAIVARAAALFAEAAELSGDRERVALDADGGTLVGWLQRAAGEPVGQVVVIGGIEGWAMDFAPMGCELASRGLDVLLLDGPGQGESRLLRGHLLSASWERAYVDVFDWLVRRAPGLPIGMVGNSMGGAVAAHLAAADARMRACCDNGGSSRPGRPRPMNSFYRKMMAHVGASDPEVAGEVWRTVQPVREDRPIPCPLLVVQGGLDPLVEMEDARRIASSAAGGDSRIVVFSDGDHCIYNHAADKHAIIGDWMRSRLAAAHSHDL